MQRIHSAAARRRQAGFTLAEMLITLLILVVVILGVLALFDLNSRVARTQTHIAEMQQSQRVAQQSIIKMARMAGRGGLPTWDLAANIELPRGVSVGIDNNVAADTQLGGCTCARVLPATDVLTVRGVITTRLHVSDPESVTDFVQPPSAGGAGSLTLYSTTDSGAPQSLDELADVIDELNGGGPPEAFLMANALGEYAVVEMTGGSKVVTGSGDDTEVTSVTVDFVNDGGTYSTAFNALSDGGSYPAAFQRVAFAGVLEEYRFYVRDRRSNPSDTESNPLPQLVRARFVPNTDTPWKNDDSSLTEVVADNILDLQFALGVDVDGDELVEEGVPGETMTPDADEWLFNDPGDDATVGLWNVDGRDLYYLRINTLARTDRPTPKYLADSVEAIEDNDWSVAPFDRFNEDIERAYQRRMISTVVDLRNL